MNDSEQNMKGVRGKNISQISDAKTTKQSIHEATAKENVEQRISSQPEDNSLSIAGFGKAKGKWAVVAIGILFALFLLWKYASKR